MTIDVLAAAATPQTATSGSFGPAAAGGQRAAVVSDAPAPRPEPVKPAAPELPDLREQLESINQLLRERRSNLSFSVDEGTGKTVVRVVRQSTGEIIRQIPSEEALAIAASLRGSTAISSIGVETQA